MTRKKYDDCFLKPEIIQAGEFQVFQLKGKDSRGFDYTFRVSPVSQKTVPGSIPETADADRVEVFVGGKPMELDKISGEVEVNLGNDSESQKIDKATLVYIPKGTPVKHRLVKDPEETTWLFDITLTPRWEGPAK